MTDPVDIIRKLYKAVKPRGILMVMDIDFYTIKPSKKLRPLFERARTIIMNGYIATGKDPEMGTNLSRYFIEAGVGMPDGTDVSGVIFTIEEAVKQMKAGMSSMKPSFFKTGVASAEELDELFAAFDEVATAENEFVLWFLKMSAWKSK
jgi:hypothetical protein